MSTARGDDPVHRQCSPPRRCPLHGQSNMHQGVEVLHERSSLPEDSASPGLHRSISSMRSCNQDVLSPLLHVSGRHSPRALIWLPRVGRKPTVHKMEQVKGVDRRRQKAESAGTGRGASTYLAPGTTLRRLPPGHGREPRATDGSARGDGARRDSRVDHGEEFPSTAATRYSTYGETLNVPDPSVPVGRSRRASRRPSTWMPTLWS